MSDGLIDPPNAGPAEFLREISNLTRIFGYKINGPFDLASASSMDDKYRAYRDNGAGQWDYV